MNTSFLYESTFQDKLRSQWTKWQRQIKHYPNRLAWWERHAKRMIRILFIQEGAERRREHTAMENFYYAAIYDILQDTHPHDTTAIALQQLKARIVRIYSMRQQRVFLDNSEHDRLAGEEPTLYHILKRRRRQESRMITSVHDSNGNKHTSTSDILRTFTTFMRSKYDDIAVDAGSVKHMARVGTKTIPAEVKDYLDLPVTLEELHLAVRKGKVQKAPGSDGICQEFFRTTWETTKHDMLAILNQMFTEGKITDRQKHGLIVCLPKVTNPTSPEDYRPITLMNADYKLLTRIIANRLRPLMTDLLQPSQHCGVPGNTILGAVAAVREAIAQATVTKTPLCILLLDFQAEFDNISHTYLFAILQSYGFSEHFIHRIQNMYENAKSSIQINGHIHSFSHTLLGTQRVSP